ncbi:hypothetical protein LINPERPRIM_LOCUS5660, partial [Linum perenne]
LFSSLFFSSRHQKPNPLISLSFKTTKNRTTNPLSLTPPMKERFLPREERSPASDDGRVAGARRCYKGIEAEACRRRRDDGAAAPNAHASTTSLGGRRRRRRGEKARRRPGATAWRRQRRHGRRGGE